MSLEYYDKVIRGTEKEDFQLIVQFLKEMVGETFLFLNYYKEIPVSYNARLLSVEHDMAEFEVHEYQAKVMALEKNVLIYSHPKLPVDEDLVGEVFYVSVARRKAVLTRFHYAKIRSGLRRFVRVCLEGRKADVDIHPGDGATVIPASINDISLGGISLRLNEKNGLEPGQDVNLILKLESPDASGITEIGALCTIVRVTGDSPPYTCIAEFHSDRHSQQALAYYINQRQVEIIKELKELAA